MAEADTLAPPTSKVVLTSRYPTMPLHYLQRAAQYIASAMEHPAYDSRECGAVYVESSIGSYAQNDAFKSEVGPNQEKDGAARKVA